ncbi:MAG: hypothetical protein AAGD13_24265 [Pseudomonadota bacterium]
MKLLNAALIAILAASVISGPVLAQDDAGSGPVDKSDKSGTNPINFTNDIRAYYEYQDLENGTGHVGTLEARTPVYDNKVQIRMRVPFKGIDISQGGFNLSESGLGDINARLLTVPYLDLKSGTAIAVGLEFFFPTATDDALGDGKFSLGPQIFGVKFNPFGIKGSLVAPAVQQVVSIVGDDDRRDVNRTQLDLFILKQSDDKKSYVLLDPQYVIDWDNQTEFGLVEAEAGYVLDSGVSFYGRPGVGFGGDSAIDFNLEFGVKYVF